MSLNGALQIGRSGLSVSQAAMQVAGNNMANASTEGYHRRIAQLTPVRGQIIGYNQFVGRGVALLSVRRATDVAMQARLRQAVSDEQAALVDQRFLASIETLQNELTENDVSSLLSRFFNSFSEIANNPGDDAVRSVAIQEGVNLANRLSTMREDFGRIRDEADRALAAEVESVNNLLEQISVINLKITQVEGTGGEASSLRDQRDILVDQVAEFTDVSVVEQDNGAADVFIGSIPVVLATVNRGIELRTTSGDDSTDVEVRVAADGTQLTVTSGSIGGLIRQRAETIEPQIDALDEFTTNLIQQVNQIHAQGQGSRGFTSISGLSNFDDTAEEFNDPLSGLNFALSNGSFEIHVTNSQTGIRSTYQINVDPNSMSLDDLVDEINTVVAVSNVTASVGIDDNFVLDAEAGYEISFANDSSGTLAALGINTFFTGTTAYDINVNQMLLDDPSLLAVGLDHIGGSNANAIELANIQDMEIAAYGGRSLREAWQQGVNNLALRTDAAGRTAESARVVRESLNAELQGVSGVSLDEESINLMQYQRAYQAAARFITVIDEMLQTLISIA